MAAAKHTLDRSVVPDPPHTDGNSVDSHIEGMEHVVLVLFENRSLDNLLGHLYEPGEVASFEGVVNKEFSNPVPEWAEHQPDGEPRIAYQVATDMDSPNPDSGEEYPHTNTQLFNVQDPANRFQMADKITAPWNVPPPGATPNMEGFVTDYISFFTAQMGRQPTVAEYSQIMTGFTPEQVPVLNGLARGFATFDHWFSEVPSQTFPNRAFWVSATSSGFVKNSPSSNFIEDNNAETIFNRLDSCGRTWKIYVLEPSTISFTGLISAPRLKDKFATNIVPFAEFEQDAANGTLPDFSLIEPSLVAGHNDYHPACGMAMLQGVDLPVDPPSSVLGGEGFLARIYDVMRHANSPTGSNWRNTMLLVGFDEPGGTYDHVPPPSVPAPDEGAPEGQCGFRFELSGYRTPAVIVSPWVDEKTVVTEEYRHTSLLATLREVWDLGEPFTQRDAGARTFQHILNRDTPRSPDLWPTIQARPVPSFTLDPDKFAPFFSGLGKAMVQGNLAFAKAHGWKLKSAPANPDDDVSAEQGLQIIEEVTCNIFPSLRPRPPTEP